MSADHPDCPEVSLSSARGRVAAADPSSRSLRKGLTENARWSKNGERAVGFQFFDRK